MKAFATSRAFNIVTALVFLLGLGLPSHAWVSSQQPNYWSGKLFKPTTTCPQKSAASPSRHHVVVFAKQTTAAPTTEKPKSANDKRWDATYERLLRYVEKEGTADVSERFNDGGKPHLGLWVRTQRRMHGKGILSDEKILKLRQAGFKLALTTQDRSKQMRDDSSWNNAFQRLGMYKHDHGNTLVQCSYNDGGKPHLGEWVSMQRRHYKLFTKTSGKHSGITQERIDLLNSIGFVWEDIVAMIIEEKWMARFKDLQTFQAKYNTTKAPILASDSDDPITAVGTWVKTQIQYYNLFMANKTTLMTMDQIKMLNATGFSWSCRAKTKHEKWLQQYFRLYYHHYLYNNSHVSNSDAYNSRFINWAVKQKQAYHDGGLDQGKIDLLDELNFDWELDPEPSWDDYYDDLREYHRQYKTTLLNKWINANLAKWCLEQRELRKQNMLDVESIAKLNLLDFDWDPVEEVWNAMYHRLLAYKKKHGNVFVPNVCSEDRPLGSWVTRQRCIYNNYLNGCDTIDESIIEATARAVVTKKLPADIHEARLRKLIEIGFVWDAFEAEWLQMYQRLLAYKNRNNSTLVPQLYESDPSLGCWVGLQRSMHAAGKLEDERMQLLDDLGFEWDPLEARWNEMFERLCAFKTEQGHTRVPGIYFEDTQLGRWVQLQRRSYKKKQLELERFQRLKSIGFEWSIR